MIFSEVDCGLGQKTGDNTAPTTKPGHAHATRPLPRQTEVIQATSTVARGTISLSASPQRVFGAIELIAHLQVHPEPRGRTEVA